MFRSQCGMCPSHKEMLQRDTAAMLCNATHTVSRGPSHWAKDSQPNMSKPQCTTLPADNTSLVLGTRAPEALAAPRHKIAMQKRRSAKKATAKKASKTRAFAQRQGDPRKALWHPPASPYGLIEEYLYEDPWKLLVACMLLNVTAGKQVNYQLPSVCGS